MKLNILSDLHLEFAGMKAPETDADVVILAGDIASGMQGIQWASQIKKPVIYIAGNHEFYGHDLERLRNGFKTHALTNYNVNFLDDREIIIDGVRFLGATLWTDFNLFGKIKKSKGEIHSCMNDYRLIRMTSKEGCSILLTPDDTEKLHEQSLEFLKRKLSEPFEGKTVVVTHHVPSIKSCLEKYKDDMATAAYASNLEYLMGESVNLWIHGHMHNSSDYTINGTRIIANPRGYQYIPDDPENESFNPTLVIEL